MKEQISAYMDNEVQDDQVLAFLLEDQEAAAQWQRYHLIGDIMRNEHKPGLNLDIAASVAKALDNEANILAPKSTNASKKAITGASNKVNKNKIVQLFSKTGHYTIAASVAAAVLLGVQQYSQTPINQVASPVFDTTPVSGFASPVSLQTTPTQMHKANEEQLTKQELLEQKQKINALLQDHQMQQRVVNQ